MDRYDVHLPTYLWCGVLVLMMGMYVCMVGGVKEIQVMMEEKGVLEALGSMEENEWDEEEEEEDDDEEEEEEEGDDDRGNEEDGGEVDDLADALGAKVAI